MGKQPLLAGFLVGPMIDNLRLVPRPDNREDQLVARIVRILVVYFRSIVARPLEGGVFQHAPIFRTTSWLRSPEPHEILNHCPMMVGMEEMMVDQVGLEPFLLPFGRRIYQCAV
jgi:hypothetical protein